MDFQALIIEGDTLLRDLGCLLTLITLSKLMTPLVTTWGINY